MNQFWNVGAVRDYWPYYTPSAIENLRWLDDPHCFRPKWIGAPNADSIDIGANGNVVFSFSLLPGSWLFGFQQHEANDIDIQITDLVANYQLFNTPASAELFASAGGFVSPFWLPEPHIMTGTGLVRVEIFNNTGTATDDSQILIAVAEPKEL